MYNINLNDYGGQMFTQMDIQFPPKSVFWDDWLCIVPQPVLICIVMMV